MLSVNRLEDSRDLILKMIDALEANVVPTNNFKGEVFCSRYGLHVDAYANPEGNKALFDMLDRVDGSRTIADIAVECGVSFNAVKDTLDQFEGFGLITYQS